MKILMAWLAVVTAYLWMSTLDLAEYERAVKHKAETIAAAKKDLARQQAELDGKSLPIKTAQR